MTALIPHPEHTATPPQFPRGKPGWGWERQGSESGATSRRTKVCREGGASQNSCGGQVVWSHPRPRHCLRLLALLTDWSLPWSSTWQQVRSPGVVDLWGGGPGLKSRASCCRGIPSRPHYPHDFSPLQPWALVLRSQRGQVKGETPNTVLLKLRRALLTNR